MDALITRERAWRNLNYPQATAAENTILDGLIAAASRGIESYCRRVFALRRYDECYDGCASRRLLLRHYPLVSVERVACCPMVVLTVTNTQPSSQRATVKVGDSGLTLMRVASGVSYTTTLAFSSHATLTALAAAINGLGSGWSAAVVDGVSGGWASADLRAIQGAFACYNATAGLRLHVLELSAYEADEARGCLVRSVDDSLALLDDAGPAWFGGSRFWRVIYTAGFPTIPEDIQEACAQWVAALFWATKRDPGASQVATVGVSTITTHADMPPQVRNLLRPYRCL